MHEAGHSAPMRRCIACRTQAPKRDLLRIARIKSEGFESTQVSVDFEGKGPGRGAYVCSVACLQKACKTRAIERALRTPMNADAYERIKEQGLAALQK